jgi:hypothetical protein
MQTCVPLDLVRVAPCGLPVTISYRGPLGFAWGVRLCLRPPKVL